MDKLMKVALMLTAVDRMSGVIGDASQKSIRSIDGIRSAALEMAEGLLLIGTAKKAFEFFGPAVDAFGEMQEAGAYLQATMMQPGGVLDTATYQRMFKFAQEMSDKYSGSTADYLDMMRVLKNNRVEEEDILGGIGEAIEKFSVLFKMKPAAMGEFAAHMRNDMAVAAKDMEQVMDLTMRSFESGVGKTGDEAVYHLNQFFSKVGLGLANLKVQGIEASKEMAVLGNMFMVRGISGESVGTNFRRILDGLRDPEKLRKANEALAKYGRPKFDFYDSSGQFKGVSNFVAEVGKLQSLDTRAIAEVLKPFSGRQGLSTDFLELMAHMGVEEYNHMAQKMFEGHATLDQQYQNVAKTMNMSKSIFQSTWQNTKAAFGALMEPTITKFYQVMNKLAVALRMFVEQHPNVAKGFIIMVTAIGGIIGAAGAIRLFVAAVRLIGMVTGVTNMLRWLRVTILLLRTGALGTIPWLGRLRTAIVWLGSGAVRGAGVALRGIRSAMIFLRGGVLSALPAIWSAITATWAWTAALLANPITWIVLGVIALAASVYLLIKNWDAVSAWFRKLWDGIKSVFSSAWEWIKGIFLKYTPHGLIISNWGKISAWFGNLWANVKEKFKGFFVFLLTLPAKFFQAGANIAKSISAGIMAFINSPIEAMKKVVTKIRNLLPFSPAKEGPLRDIHRIRLVETIADGLSHVPLVDKMSKVIKAGISFRSPELVAQMAGGGGRYGAVPVTYAPVIHIHGNMDAQSKDWLLQALSDNSKKVVDLLQQELDRRARKQYT